MKQFDLVQNFDSLYELVMYFDSPQKCEDHLAQLRWNGEPECPTCECKNVRMLQGKRKQYKCYGCKRKFSVKTGSIFHDSKLPLIKWFIAIFLFTSHKRGISSHQLSRDLKISQKSAWFMLHRIRECFKVETEEKLDGVVQIDETYVGGEIKNMSNSKRAEIHKDGRVRGSHHQAPVVGMIDEEGQVRAEAIEKPNKATIKPIMEENIDASAIIVTDGSRIYDYSEDTWRKHYVVKHSIKQYVNDGYHTNGIENFWSHFKRTIAGTYFHMKDFHLDEYVQESAFRYNTRNIGEGERFDLTLSNSNKTLSWDELVRRKEKRA